MLFEKHNSFLRLLKNKGFKAERRTKNGLYAMRQIHDPGIQQEPHNITMASRAYPEVSCEVIFEPREWQTLYTMQQHCHPPPTPPPLREMVRSLAQCGGFFARRGDGEPGIKAIWQGYQRLHDFIDAIETYRTVHAGERNV